MAYQTPPPPESPKVAGKVETHPENLKKIMGHNVVFAMWSLKVS